MKILLVHPPADHGVPAAYRTESLGLGYIASALRRDGHEIEVFDAHLMCIATSAAVREILARDFDSIGITAANASAKAAIAIAKAVRFRRKNALITCGGYLPTLSPEHLLVACPELDFIVRGEGETAASDVFGRISRDEDWRDTPGIAYLKGGKPILNPLPPLVLDLDFLPFPARDALSQATVPVSAGIASSRGCYHRCSFCCIQSFYALSGGPAPRFRSPKNVVDEIESVVNSTGIREFRFVDDDFIGPGPKTRARVVNMAEEMRSRKLDISFKIEFRADEVDEEILRRLKEVGLTEVFLGIESGVQAQLDRYNKRVTVEQNRKAIEIVRASGIKLRSGFIMFDPYTTVAELQENVQFIRDMGLEAEAKRGPAPFVTKLVLHRGVPMMEKLRHDGLIVERGIDVDYSFQDPQVRMMGRVALVTGALGAAMKRVKGLLHMGR